MGLLRRYSQRIACLDGHDAPREDADAVRDGARLCARVPRLDRGRRGAAADGGGPRARPQRPAVGLPLLRALALGVLPRGRCDRRPRRSPPHVHRRRHPLRACIAPHGARAERGGADRRPRSAGSGWCGADDDEPGAAPRDLGGRGRPGDRSLDVADESRDGRRAAARRRHRADRLVAVGVPDQRPARGRHRRARPGRARQRREDARPLDSRSRRLGSRRRQPDRAHLLARRGSRAGTRGGLALPRRSGSSRSSPSSCGR